MTNKTAYFHLPGLYEFHELYKLFIPLFYEHREYFYDWCAISSIYGSPSDFLWSGGRLSIADNNTAEVLSLLNKHSISPRLTFSNSLLEEKHLADKKCNNLCKTYNQNKGGIIIHSDLLLDYLQKEYPNLYYISSTTKVITDKEKLIEELNRKEFTYVVPDFRLNKQLFDLDQKQKDKVEFLCNECCYTGCTERKKCYENVSRINLDMDVEEHLCKAPYASEGYVFSRAMESPAFISIEDIQNVYLPQGFSNFKIEGRSLGSALVLEFLLYYLTKPEYQLKVREAIYLNHSLDLF